jgi:STAM-binding protein
MNKNASYELWIKKLTEQAEIEQLLKLNKKISFKQYLFKAKQLIKEIIEFRSEKEYPQLYIILLRFINLYVNILSKHEENKNITNKEDFENMKSYAYEYINEAEELKRNVLKKEFLKLLKNTEKVDEQNNIFCKKEENFNKIENLEKNHSNKIENLEKNLIKKEEKIEKENYLKKIEKNQEKEKLIKKSEKELIKNNFQNLYSNEDYKKNDNEKIFEDLNFEDQINQILINENNFEEKNQFKDKNFKEIEIKNNFNKNFKDENKEINNYYYKNENNKNEIKYNYDNKNEIKNINKNFKDENKELNNFFNKNEENNYDNKNEIKNINKNEIKEFNFEKNKNVEIKEELKKINMNKNLINQFFKYCKYNQDRNLEFCGILSGVLKNNEYYISHLLIPQQKCTSDSCFAVDDLKLFNFQNKNNLITLGTSFSKIGWIHTHPSQSAFLSSIDLKNHYSYQLLLKESIAIVLAPTKNPKFLFFLIIVLDILELNTHME